MGKRQRAAPHLGCDAEKAVVERRNPLESILHLSIPSTFNNGRLLVVSSGQALGDCSSIYSMQTGRSI